MISFARVKNDRILLAFVDLTFSVMGPQIGDVTIRLMFAIHKKGTSDLVMLAWIRTNRKLDIVAINMPMTDQFRGSRWCVQTWQIYLHRLMIPLFICSWRPAPFALRERHVHKTMV
ncbi:hypothetical protein VL15_38135 [Burkholderia cepacia]|uniref:Uncharacterized protein n=1 Tax=Burkholderia cepacia TaxID=292 RepID=A0A0J5VZ23_BURCE|nr:hypothetical protein VL15_38135 [Burkholderia cepacia]